MEYVISFNVVRFDSRLSPGARLLFEEIYTIASNNLGCCPASNGYFASKFNVCISTIKNYINELEVLGYIDREQTQDKRRRTINIGTKFIEYLHLFPVVPSSVNIL